MFNAKAGKNPSHQGTKNKQIKWQSDKFKYSRQWLQ